MSEDRIFYLKTKKIVFTVIKFYFIADYYELNFGYLFNEMS